jgi:hypothetical protein
MINDEESWRSMKRKEVFILAPLREPVSVGLHSSRSIIASYRVDPKDRYCETLCLLRNGSVLTN